MGSENAYRANGYTKMQSALRPSHDASKLRHPQHEGNHKHSLNIYVCVCLHRYMYECVYTYTHTSMFSLSGYVFTHIPVPILANILLRTHAHMYIHTHTVSHVTLTRHTIVVGASSEKREVDSLHHEK